MLISRKNIKLTRKIVSVFLLSMVLAGCANESIKRAIMLPAAVEREQRERELKANSLVVPPKYHKSPSNRELAKKAHKVTDAPLYTVENKPNPEAVEPDVEQEREDERIDTLTPGSDR